MKLILLMFSLCIFSKSFSQEILPNVICSSSQVSLMDECTIRLKSISQRNYIIPVVFHVFDSYSPQDKLSEEQAQKALDLLNANFNGLSRNVAYVQDAFKGLIAEVGFKFVLAKKDPYGNPINGISYHRKNIKGDNPGANLTMKALVNWNTGSNVVGKQRYLQIWCTYNVNGEDRGSGWCYLPEYDQGGKWAGPVYNYKFLGDGSSDNDDILTHEIGHYFGLSHVFGSNYTSCGDDGISDTPETRCYSWKCKKGNLCYDGMVNTENFMDYSGCTSMFTTGQKERMIYWMNQPARKTLWSKENLNFTGVPDVNVEDVTTYVEDAIRDDVSIFPNPSNGNFNVRGIDDFSLKIYNLSGKLVYQTDKHRFYYGNPGIYVVEIKNDAKVIKIKVVVN